MKKIIHFVQIKAPRKRVYEALATPKGLAGWWSTGVSWKDEDRTIVDFRFLDGFNPDMQVTSREEDHLVTWKCIDGHDNWLDNTFSFELADSDEGTSLMFVQVYAQELGDEVYGTYNFNWGYYLGSLQKLCQEGKGTPFEAQ